MLAGDVSKGRFELKGDLWHFPFRDASQGRFFVEASIDGGSLQYHPAWPTVDRVKGDIRFENARMEIRAREATIYASRARSASAVIADLGAKPPVLEVEGDLETTGVDSTRFLRETPLVNGPGAFTRVVSVEGPARLKLKLDWPLWGSTPFRVAGEYAFAGATASVGRSLLLTGIRGPLAFTEKSVRAPELVGTMFGQPATLRLSTQPDGSVLTQLDGRMGAPALGAFIPDGFARRMAGAADWKARVVSGAEATELRIESDLKGLAIGLPEPFAKRADESRALAVTIRKLGADDEETVAALEGGVHARIGRTDADGATRWNAALKFGAPVSAEPVREGLWLYGDLARFDLDAWQEALAAPAGAPPRRRPPPSSCAASTCASPPCATRGATCAASRPAWCAKAASGAGRSRARSWRATSPSTSGARAGSRRAFRASRSGRPPRARRARSPPRPPSRATCRPSTSWPSASSSAAAGWAGWSSSPGPTARTGASTAWTSRTSTRASPPAARRGGRPPGPSRSST